MSKRIEVYNIVSKARKAKGLSVYALSKCTNFEIQQTTIKNYEKGLLKLPLEKVKVLLECLDLTISINDK